MKRNGSVIEKRFFSGCFSSSLLKFMPEWWWSLHENNTVTTAEDENKNKKLERRWSFVNKAVLPTMWMSSRMRVHDVNIYETIVNKFVFFFLFNSFIAVGLCVHYYSLINFMRFNVEMKFNFFLFVAQSLLTLSAIICDEMEHRKPTDAEYAADAYVLFFVLFQYVFIIRFLSGEWWSNLMHFILLFIEMTQLYIINNDINSMQSWIVRVLFFASMNVAM